MCAKIYKTIFPAFFILMIALSSNSITAGELKTIVAIGSNLIGFSYPDHLCDIKPVKPEKAPVLSAYIDVDAYNIAVAQYNVRVALYNKKIKVYKKCINKYIESGNHDIDTIRKKLNSALKEARTKN